MFLLIYEKAVFIMIIVPKGKGKYTLLRLEVGFRRHRMDNQNNNKNPKNNRQGWGVILVTTLLVTFIVLGLYSLMQDNNPEEISYDKFLELDRKSVV